MILDSQAPVDVENETVITGFDPTIAAGSYYTIGYFLTASPWNS